jgi:hypothetical protein
MPCAISLCRRTVRIFLARPRFLWNSPKRLIPIDASRMISSDQRSPKTSSALAMGHAAFSKLVRMTLSGLDSLAQHVDEYALASAMWSAT